MKDFHNLHPNWVCVEVDGNAMKSYQNSWRHHILYDIEHCYAGVLYFIATTTIFDRLQTYRFDAKWEAHEQSPTRVLWCDMSISVVSKRGLMASPHQWPSIAPDLSWLQTIIWLLSLGILPTRIKTKPNHRYILSYSRISWAVLIKISQWGHYHNV